MPVIGYANQKLSISDFPMSVKWVILVISRNIAKKNYQ